MTRAYANSELWRVKVGTFYMGPYTSKASAKRVITKQKVENAVIERAEIRWVEDD